MISLGCCNKKYTLSHSHSPNYNQTDTPNRLTHTHTPSHTQKEITCMLILTSQVHELAF